MRMNKFHEYVIVAETYKLNKDTPTIDVLLNAQMVYVNSLYTYNEVNTIIQRATEHLDIAQLGTTAGIMMWGKQGAEAIIKEMK